MAVLFIAAKATDRRQNERFASFTRPRREQFYRRSNLPMIFNRLKKDTRYSPSI